MANLNLTFGDKEDMLPEEEADIYNYITNNEDECFDEVLAKENRWKAFYHFSEMRTSILNWYDFGEDKSILEIGGGFGAITGMLCQRGKSVTVVEKSTKKAEAIYRRYHDRDNLTVYAGNIKKISFYEKFDYVVIVGVLCDDEDDILPNVQLSQYISMTGDWLKESGVLLVAAENHNGAKYKCGYPKPEYGSKNENGCEAMVTKEQLENMVKIAGFRYVKFYYPFPDYKLTQEIYTDIKLPEGSIKDRVLTYYVLPGMMQENEHKLYEKELKKGDIREVCNSYLIEASRRDIQSEVSYVAVSTDRGKKHSFATAIVKNQVIKAAIYEEGKENLKKSYDNILKIRDMGISIVPHSYRNDKLIMPLIESPKLVDWLYLIAVENKIKFLQAIDKIRECIVKSSKSVKKDGKEFLQSGYIDMIPLNCFADSEEFYFFDQEFCVENCPLDYIMFRVLRYTYLSYPDLELYVSIDDMIKRYGLEYSWQSYLLMEDEFIWENRQHKVNHCFYKWINNGNII